MPLGFGLFDFVACCSHTAHPRPVARRVALGERPNDTSRQRVAPPTAPAVTRPSRRRPLRVDGVRDAGCATARGAAPTQSSAMNASAAAAAAPASGRRPRRVSHTPPCLHRAPPPLPRAACSIRGARPLLYSCSIRTDDAHWRAGDCSRCGLLGISIAVPSRGHKCEQFDQ